MVRIGDRAVIVGIHISAHTFIHVVITDKSALGGLIDTSVYVSLAAT